MSMIVQRQKQLPLTGPLQLRDVPRPHPVGCGGDQLGLLARRMRGLPAPFADLTVFAQDPVHRHLGAQVDAAVQQHRTDPGRRHLGELGRAQHGQDLCLLRLCQGPWMPPALPLRPFRSRGRAVVAIPGRPAEAECGARLHPSHQGRQ